jgi:hypothetical protein
MILLVLVVVVVLCTTTGGQRLPEAISAEAPVRIALALDKGSLQDIMVLLESITTVADEPKFIVFHVVFVGASGEEAQAFMDSTMVHVRGCFPNVQVVGKPFSFPRTSGFIKQVSRDNSGSGWVSPMATDMVRFFVASLFPDVPRLLYLDNDVVVTCCLEQVWMQTLKPGTALGIVVDNIPWSVTTQFAQHYNSSHPLVIQAIRNHMPKGTKPPDDFKPHRVSLKEFNGLMQGKYPNDGVLLIDTAAFNALDVLGEMEAIALANSPSADRIAGCSGAACEGTSWVVSLGSQQFTVLGLAGRWTEMEQRANVRHFPDKARGFLMWFYFHGFLHFAGRMKPRDMCARVEARTMREMTAHRLQTYTPFAITAKKLYAKCPASVHPIMSCKWCSKHIPDASTGAKLLEVARGWLHTRQSLSKKEMPDSNHHIRIGSMRGDLQCVANCTSSLSPDGDIVVELDRLLVHRSPLSFTVFTGGKRSGRGRGASATIKQARDIVMLPPKHPKRHKQAGRKRSFVTSDVSLCDGSDPSRASCQLLKEVLLKKYQLDHWTVTSMTIDTNGVAGVSALGLLMEVDLTFIRPKILVVKLGPYGLQDGATLQADIAAAVRVIGKNVMDVHSATGADPYCACQPDTLCACVWGIRLNVLETPPPKSVR